MDQTPMARLAAFLVEAKRRTYAGLDDDATVSTPIIARSKQLEYSDGELSYRDIYFGMAFFIGQEVVTDKQRAIWSMSYGGGVSSDITDRDKFLGVYAFLRKALLAKTGRSAAPGNSCKAAIATSIRRRAHSRSFTAPSEFIWKGMPVYGLRYSGGIIR
jgi:hypothetical protein